MRVKLLTVITMLLMLSCSKNGADIAGGSTETVGMILTATGVPVEGAKVLFIPVDYSPNSSSKTLLDSTVSDNRGEFTFDNLADGEYNIAYNKDSLKAFRKSLLVRDGKIDSSIVDTLKRVGSITGIVRVLPNHSSKDVYIIAIGSDRYTQPIDSIGNFVFNNLAEGHYTLKFITTLPSYEPLDTQVTIKATVDDTLSDTLHIPYIGIPSPTRASISYDSLLQRVTVNFSPVESPRFSSYQISRREATEGSSFTVVKSGGIDTTLSEQVGESDIVQGKSYIYRVSAVDTSGVCSKPIYLDTVTVSTAFKTTITVSFTGEINAITSNGLGRIYITKKGSPTVYEFEENSLKLIREISIPDSALPRDLVVMSDSTILIATNRGVYNIDRDGKKLYRYSVNTTNIASTDARYLYYSEQGSISSGISRIKRLDTFTGIEKTLIDDSSRTVCQFRVENGAIYTLFNYFGKYELERSNIDNYSGSVIFTTTNNREYSGFSIGSSRVTLLLGNQLLNLKNGSSLEGQTTLGAKGKVLVLNNSRVIVGTSTGELSIISW